MSNRMTEGEGRAALLEAEAERQARAGNIDVAEACYRQAWAAAPSVLRGVSAAAAALNAGRLRRAGDVLRRVETLAPDSVALFELQGQLALMSADAKGAVKAFARALILDPADLNAQWGKERALEHLAVKSSPIRRGRTIYLRGQFGGVSGYGHMTRQFEQALYRRGVSLGRMGLLRSEGATTTGAPARGLVSFMTPVSFEPLAGADNLLFSMYEGVRIPSAWRRRCEKADLIATPTSSSLAAWLEAGFDRTRLRICPLGVELDDAAPSCVPVLTTPDGRDVTAFSRRFINVSDLVPRKNLDGLFRVWLRSTTVDDDAVLVVKAGKGGAGDRALIAQYLRRAIADVGYSFDKAAPIIFLDKMLTDEEMRGLLRLGSHYWSMSRGEGWDLPLTQAGAMGLEVLAPRHSAYMDYLDETVAALIPSRPVPAINPLNDQPPPPFFGAEWWEPDEEAAVALVRRAIDGVRVSSGLAQRLRRDYSWDVAGAQLHALLSERGLA